MQTIEFTSVQCSIPHEMTPIEINLRKAGWGFITKDYRALTVKAQRDIVYKVVH